MGEGEAHTREDDGEGEEGEETEVGKAIAGAGVIGELSGAGEGTRPSTAASSGSGSVMSDSTGV